MALEEEVSSLRDALNREKERLKNIWHINCEQLTKYDDECSNKDSETAALLAQIVELEHSHEHEHSSRARLMMHAHIEPPLPAVRT